MHNNLPNLLRAALSVQNAYKERNVEIVVGKSIRISGETEIFKYFFHIQLLFPAQIIIFIIIFLQIELGLVLTH